MAIGKTRSKISPVSAESKTVKAKKVSSLKKPLKRKSPKIPLKEHSSNAPSEPKKHWIFDFGFSEFTFQERDPHFLESNEQRKLNFADKRQFLS